MSIYKGVVQRAQLQLARFQVKSSYLSFKLILKYYLKCHIEKSGAPIDGI